MLMLHLKESFTKLSNIFAFGNNIKLYGIFKVVKFMICLLKMLKNGLNYLMKLELEEKHLKLVMIVNNLELWL